MRCPTCGSSTRELETPKVGGLQFDAEDRISGVISVKWACPTCGTSDGVLAVEIEVQVPPEHRKTDHELEIDFEPHITASETAGFPVRISCSCGHLRSSGCLTCEGVINSWLTDQRWAFGAEARPEREITRR